MLAAFQEKPEWQALCYNPSDFGEPQVLDVRLGSVRRLYIFGASSDM